MSTENLEIVRKYWKLDKVPENFPIILEIKSGKKATYHNFTSGENYDTEEEAIGGKKSILFKKASKMAQDVMKGNTLCKTVTKAEQIAVAYDVVCHKNVKFLAIYIVKFNLYSRLITADEKRNWQIIARMYVDESKTCYLQRELVAYYFHRDRMPEGDFYESNNLYLLYNWQSFWNINHLNGYYWPDLNLYENCKKMGWGVVTIGNNTRMELSNAYNLLDFLKYKEPSKKKGPKQRKVDELTALPLEDINIPQFDEGRSDKNRYFDPDKFANISAVCGMDSPICCYRTFQKGSNNEISEGARIYIEPKGVFTACKKNNVGEWVNISLSGSNDSFAYKLTYVNKEAVKGTVLEYLVPAFKELEEENKSGVLLALTVRHPCVEMLYKSPCFKPVVDHAIRVYGNAWSEIEDHLGKINEKGKTFYNIIGLNKSQLDVLKDAFTPEVTEIYAGILESSFITIYQIIKNLKHSFAKSNISDIDIDTFKAMLDLIISAYKFEHIMKYEGKVSSSGKLCQDQYYTANKYIEKLCESMYIISSYFSIATVRSMIPKMKELFMNHEETLKTDYAWKNGQCTPIEGYSLVRTFDTYNSYLTMLQEIYSIDWLEEKPNFSCHFQNYDHIKVMHDDIVPISDYYRTIVRSRRSAEKYKEELEKWQHLKRIWKQWEYEDDEYIVIYPNEPHCLTTEGTTLGHCVGGYIDKVLKRDTNILFIRRKEAPEEPFFTVEILTSGVVEQIHGRSNCNISSPKVVKDEPNLGLFVEKWAREKNLTLNSINKIR